MSSDASTTTNDFKLQRRNKPGMATTTASSCSSRTSTATTAANGPTTACSTIVPSPTACETEGVQQSIVEQLQQHTDGNINLCFEDEQPSRERQGEWQRERTSPTQGQSKSQLPKPTDEPIDDESTSEEAGRETDCGDPRSKTIAERIEVSTRPTSRTTDRGNAGTSNSLTEHSASRATSRDQSSFSVRITNARCGRKKQIETESSESEEEGTSGESITSGRSTKRVVNERWRQSRAAIDDVHHIFYSSGRPSRDDVKWIYKQVYEARKELSECMEDFFDTSLEKNEWDKEVQFIQDYANDLSEVDIELLDGAKYYLQCLRAEIEMITLLHGKGGELEINPWIQRPTNRPEDPTPHVQPRILHVQNPEDFQDERDSQQEQKRQRLAKPSMTRTKYTHEAVSYTHLTLPTIYSV